MQSFQLFPYIFVVRYGLGNQAPEIPAVIEFLEVTDLVDDHVIAELCRQECYFVIEIKIAFFRTTAPATALVPNGNFSYRKSVMLIEICHAFMDERTH